MNEFYKDLWVKAQENAKKEYEEEWGEGSWDEADKYEREDWAFAEYDRLRKERENMERLNNNTTNTNSIKKGNDTMNKMNAKEMRMETLKANNIDTTNFFDLSMRVPFGAEVKILVDGKEMVIPATNGKATGVVENGLVGNYVGMPIVFTSNGDVCNAETGEVLVMANPNSITVNGIVDPIAQSIINDGYVKNSKLFRRFVTAHTFKLLDYVDRKNPNRKGWEAGFKDMYSYGYVFDMLKDELHTLAKLQKEDPEYFAERTRFFNGAVVVVTLEDYLYRLKKYCKKQMRENPRKYRGDAYVKLARYGNVLVKDLEAKVYIPIRNGIKDVNGVVHGNDYRLIEKTFNTFMDKLYNKLPYETPKCAVFKDAYKGAGAYYSLQNMCRWHNVVLKGCNHKYDSELKLKELLNGEYKNDVWKFYQLLVDTIDYNNFDLRKSIASGNAAPNTISDKADRYKR